MVMSLNYPGIRKMKSIQPEWKVGLAVSVKNERTELDLTDRLIIQIASFLGK